jgi:probable HAF family extracellular repeat protein
VGYSAIAGSPGNPTTTHAFLWQAGTMRDLLTLGGASSDAVAINAAGQVTGKSLASDGVTHAFVLDPTRCQPPHD